MARRGIQPLAIVALSVIIIAWFLVNYGASISVSTVIGSNIASVFPGLLITFLGIIVAVEAKNSSGVVACFAIVGIGLAILLGEMHTTGIVTNAMLLPATLIQYQTIVVVVAFLLGAVVYVGGRN